MTDYRDMPHMREQAGEDRTYDPPTVDVTDLGLAAALVCQRIPLIRLRRISPTRVAFEFPDDARSEIERIDQSFINRELHVEAKGYFDTVRILKAHTKSL